jgi:hypothetical protein
MERQVVLTALAKRPGNPVDSPRHSARFLSPAHREAAMPTKPKTKPKFTFEETEFGFEIGLKSGARRRVILFCKVGEDCTELPASTTLLFANAGR